MRKGGPDVAAHVHLMLELDIPSSAKHSDFPAFPDFLHRPCDDFTVALSGTAGSAGGVAGPRRLRSSSTKAQVSRNDQISDTDRAGHGRAPRGGGVRSRRVQGPDSLS